MATETIGETYRPSSLEGEGWDKVEGLDGLYRRDGEVARFRPGGGGLMLLDMGPEGAMLFTENVWMRRGIDGGPYADVTTYLPTPGALVDRDELAADGWEVAGVTEGDCHTLYVKKSHKGKDAWVLEVDDGLDGGCGYAGKVHARHHLRKGDAYGLGELRDKLGLEVVRDLQGSNKALCNGRLYVSVGLVNDFHHGDYGKWEVLQVRCRDPQGAVE